MTHLYIPGHVMFPTQVRDSSFAEYDATSCLENSVVKKKNMLRIQPTQFIIHECVVFLIFYQTNARFPVHGYLP